MCGASEVVEVLLGSSSRGSRVPALAVLKQHQCVVGWFNLWDEIEPVRKEWLEKALHIDCWWLACSCTCVFKLYVGFLSTMCERAVLLGYVGWERQSMTCYGLIRTAVPHLVETFMMLVSAAL